MSLDSCCIVVKKFKRVYVDHRICYVHVLKFKRAYVERGVFEREGL